MWSFAKKSDPSRSLHRVTNTARWRAKSTVCNNHGLNRCLDVGLDGCRRYLGCGVMSCNLHGIGPGMIAAGTKAKRHPGAGALKPPTATNRKATRQVRQTQCRCRG
jgi:hypothetical protein